MPVYEQQQKKGWGWPAYLAIGCGGCAVLVVIALVGSAMVGLYYAKKGMNQVMSGTLQGTAKADVQLPDGNGTLTYWFNPLSSTSHTTTSQSGMQGLRLATSNGKTQKWLLMREHQPSQFEVYWHPASNGSGPFVRLKDTYGEVAVDVAQQKTGFLRRSAGRVYLSCESVHMPVFNDKDTSMIAPANGNIKTNSPAAAVLNEDITAALPSDGVHLGTIVRNGSTLTFTPAPAGTVN